MATQNSKELSKLQEELEYLTGLIRSHKHADRQFSRPSSAYHHQAKTSQTYYPAHRSSKRWVKPSVDASRKVEIYKKQAPQEISSNKNQNSKLLNHDSVVTKNVGQVDKRRLVIPPKKGNDGNDSTVLSKKRVVLPCSSKTSQVLIKNKHGKSSVSSTRSSTVALSNNSPKVNDDFTKPASQKPASLRKPQVTQIQSDVAGIVHNTNQKDDIQSVSKSSRTVVAHSDQESQSRKIAKDTCNVKENEKMSQPSKFKWIRKPNISSTFTNKSSQESGKSDMAEQSMVSSTSVLPNNQGKNGASTDKKRTVILPSFISSAAVKETNIEISKSSSSVDYRKNNEEQKKSIYSSRYRLIKNGAITIAEQNLKNSNLTPVQQMPESQKAQFLVKATTQKLVRHSSAPAEIICSKGPVTSTPVLQKRGKYKLVKRSHTASHPYRLFTTPPKFNTSHGLTRLTTPFKLTSNGNASSPKLTNISQLSPIMSPTVLSEVKRRTSLKSRYKLVKRAIETTHKMKQLQVQRSLPDSKYSWSPSKISNVPKGRGVQSYSKMMTRKLKLVGSTRESHKLQQGKKTWTKKYSLQRDNSGMTSPRSLNINQLLGRRVCNASRNKFKFINPKSKKAAKLSMVSKNRSLSLDRRTGRNKIGRSIIRKGHLVNIGGINYKSSKRKLVKTSQGCSQYGNHFKSWKGSHKVDHSTVHRILNRAYKVDRTRIFASRVVQKSIYTAHQARYKKTNKQIQSNNYCLYYNRFGRCNRGDKCPNIHDPKRIAICTRFLRGRCEVTNCPFSHNVSKEKMPVCQFFIRRVCFRDNCPYLHSNVSKDAQICDDFVYGFCILGDMCTKKHTLTCPEFSKDGKCSKGRKCRLKHIAKATRKRKLQNQEKNNSLPAKVSREEAQAVAGEVDQDDITRPMKERKLPSFIALHSVDTPEAGHKKTPTQDGVTLHIHPRLSFEGENSSAQQE